MLREYAMKAWEAEKEKQKQSDHKKRKRKAKKIEEEIYDLGPKVTENYDFHRHLEDEKYDVIVSLSEDGQTMRFTFDDKDDLTLIGICPGCSLEAISKPINTAADLGQMIESFEAGSSHRCSTIHP